jgi:alkylation response protein AidB-like acyl-CoA dehydrogenase
MDISYPAEAEQFRAEVKAFLDEHLPPGWTGIGALDEDSAWAFARDWRVLLAERGFLSVTWPTEYGGLGLSKLHHVVLVEELARVGAPWGMPHDTFGVKMLANTLLRWATEEQKRTFLPRILDGRTCGARATPSPARVRTWPR